MKFTETEVCKSKINCFACRREKPFRDSLEKQFGKWECPLGISLDAPDSAFPKETIEMQKRQEEAKEKEINRRKEIDNLFLELEMCLTGEALLKLHQLQILINPKIKESSKCRFGGKKIGEVDEPCCGGKIKKVDAYSCSKHSLTTNKKCFRCSDFSFKE